MRLKNRASYSRHWFANGICVLYQLVKMSIKIDDDDDTDVWFMAMMMAMKLVEKVMN